MDKVKSKFDAAHDPLQRYRLYARGYGFVVVALLIIAAGVPAAGAGVSGVLALLSGVYLGRLWVWGGAAAGDGEGAAPWGHRDSGSGRFGDFCFIGGASRLRCLPRRR